MPWRTPKYGECARKWKAADKDRTGEAISIPIESSRHMKNVRFLRDAGRYWTNGRLCTRRFPQFSKATAKTRCRHDHRRANPRICSVDVRACSAAAQVAPGAFHGMIYGVTE
jgi:hypothetical protein